MQYWIARNNQKLGPYSLTDVQRMMTDGNLVNSDLAWTEGMANWGPVFDVVPTPQAAAPAPRAPEALAPTRMVPAYRPPPDMGGQGAGQLMQPAASQPAAAQPFQPVQPQSQPFQAPAQPYPAPPPAQSAPAQPAPPQPQPAQAFSPQAQPMAGQPMQGQPYQPAQQFQPQPPAAQPFQAPPAAQPFQAQPYPGQPFQTQPPAAQPFQAPYPSQPFAGQAAPGAGPVPPGMHWALVLVLGSITFGIFYIVWIIKELNFIKSIDPRNNSGKLIMIAIALVLVYVVLMVGAVTLQSTTAIALGGALGSLIDIGAAALSIVAYFKMRSSLVNYYNTVEPIGLRLSGAMTFFFNILYFQYHFHRIAEWKRTGVLRPQG
jgi:hypothetical protein